MNARSALFDLYGDHLRARGGAAPVAALVRLLAPLGVAAPAVRTAVSRMVRQGWLAPVRLAGGPGYTLTPRAVRRLDDAATRIYRTRLEGWNGTWHLIITTLPGERSRRDRLRAGLTFLGYAQLDDATWIGPRWSEEVDLLLETESVRAERFLARHDGDSLGLVRRAWDLEGLSRAYARWLAEAENMVAGTLDAPTDEQSFAARSQLVHEWRKFLFLDPGLPQELLPEQWTGGRAADFFDAENTRLLPASTRFVDHCLTQHNGSLGRAPGDLSGNPSDHDGGSSA
ncbi:MAG: phenylacetic acid degradation operon negative regulatory protein [Actinomycetota bacterium]|nr:phenylacetic acid degradation operon negative regulatory protein [Actinomycetota bacterium]